MPISTTPTTPIPINTLVLLAYKRAGVLPVEATTSGANFAAKLAHGKTLLDLMLDNLAVEGFYARQMSFLDVAIVAGTAAYTLPDTVLDVYEDAMFAPTGEDTELVVRQIGLGAYQALTDKTVESERPNLYVVSRAGATPAVTLWPIPSAAGTLRMKAVRLLGDNQTTANTPDLQRYWLDALVWMLAWYVAVDSSMPIERCTYLQANALAKKKEAMAYNFEHPPQQAVFAYTTQWSA